MRRRLRRTSRRSESARSSAFRRWRPDRLKAELRTTEDRVMIEIEDRGVLTILRLGARIGPLRHPAATLSHAHLHRADVAAGGSAGPRPGGRTGRARTAARAGLRSGRGAGGAPAGRVHGGEAGGAPADDRGGTA